MKHIPRIGITTAFGLLCLATQTFAQSSMTSSATPVAPKPSTSPSSTPSTSSKAAAATHVIDVGKGDHKFAPDVTMANVGDVLEFHFFPANHSVVRAEYLYPCIPYEMTGQNKVGFFAGFHPVQEILDDPPKYRITVNDTAPMFFYCSAPDSCQTYGMVGVINPNSSTPITTQHNLALKAAYMLQPGDPFPEESPNLPSTSTTTGAPIPTSSDPSNASQNQNQNHRAFPPGAIAGIVLGALFVIGLALGLFFYIGRSKSLREEMVRKASTIRRVTPPESPKLQMQLLQSYWNAPSSNVSPTGGVVLPPMAYQQHGYSGAGDKTAAVPTAGAGMERSGSHRSVGGTFEISPTTGYSGTPHSTGIGSPNSVGWNANAHTPHGVALGPYGGGHPAAGWTHGRAVNEGQPAEMPAEMDGIGVDYSFAANKF